METPKQPEPPKPSPLESGKESASQGREGDDELVEIVINGRKYKVPKRFTVATEFPMLPIGKIDKQALKRGAR